MGFKNLVRLSFKNILNNKIYAVIAVLIVSILFSIISTLNFIIQGLEDNIIHAGLTATNNRVLVSANFCDGDYQNEEKKCEEAKIYDRKAQDISKKYRGETFGAVITYSNPNNEKAYVILDKAAKFLSVDSAIYSSSDKIFVVAWHGTKDDSLASSTKINTEIFQVVGYYPNSDAKIRSVENSDGSSFIDNYIFQEHSNIPYYMILDNDSKVQNYLAENGFTMQNYAPVIEFDNYDDAYRFYTENSGSIRIEELFAGTLKNRSSYEQTFSSLSTLLFVLILVAVIVFGILSIFMIKRDSKTILLYRTLGATTKGMFIMYLTELIMLSVVTVLLVIGFSIIAASIISGNHEGAIQTSMESAFGFSIGLTQLIGFNSFHIVIFFSILLSASISSLVNIYFLSTENIIRDMHKK